MARRFTGNDPDGITLIQNLEFWENQEGTIVRNTGPAVQFLSVSGTIFVVKGTITSAQDNGFEADSFSHDLTIAIRESGVVRGADNGIFLDGSLHVVNNFGIVRGLGDAGIAMLDGINNIIRNEGEITAENVGVDMDGDNAFVRNNGRIDSNGIGIRMESDGGSIINTDTIVADGRAIDFRAGSDDTSLINVGRIITRDGDSAVNGHGGDDNIDIRGVISGDVRLGDGEDVFIYSGGGFVRGRVDGGFDDDRLIGGQFGDEFDGGGADDTLNGNGGVDTLDGGTGDDIVRGGRNSDFLFGGTDDDSLFGGAGRDTRHGETGDDDLIGGGAADRFIFASVDGDDRVLDFANDIDTLDVTEFGLTRQALRDAAAQVGDDVVLTFLPDTTLTVLDIRVGALLDDDVTRTAAAQVLTAIGTPTSWSAVVSAFIAADGKPPLALLSAMGRYDAGALAPAHDRFRELYHQGHYVMAAFLLRFGDAAVDVLVANAGIRRDSVLAMMSPDDWSAVLATNLTGSYTMAKFAVQNMMRQRYGRIVFTTSPAGRFGFEGQGNYAASKAGQVGLARALCKEVAKRKITVNCVSPGFIQTDLIDDLPDELATSYRKSVPAKRFGTTDEVASAVLYLASREASCIAGAALDVTGGL